MLLCSYHTPFQHPSTLPEASRRLKIGGKNSFKLLTRVMCMNVIRNASVAYRTNIYHYQQPSVLCEIHTRNTSLSLLPCINYTHYTYLKAVFHCLSMLPQHPVHHHLASFPRMVYRVLPVCRPPPGPASKTVTRTGLYQALQVQQ